MIKFSKIKPLFNRVLVKRVEPPQKTAGGILLPNQGNSKIGQILDVGIGRQNQKGELIKPSLLPGQFVLLPDYGGLKVPKQEGSEEEQYIYQEEDIIGVVEGSFSKL